jgi:hypothetical protein
MKFDPAMQKLINSLEPEHRIPVHAAARASDGTVDDFQRELVSQVWEFPDLDVQGIMDKLSANMVD